MQSKFTQAKTPGQAAFGGNLVGLVHGRQGSTQPVDVLWVITASGQNIYGWTLMMERWAVVEVNDFQTLLSFDFVLHRLLIKECGKSYIILSNE